MLFTKKSVHQDTDKISFNEVSWIGTDKFPKQAPIIG